MPDELYLIDSHCHLDFSDFDEDLADVLSFSRELGVQQCLLVGTHPGRFERQMERCRQFSMLRPAFGFHPWFLDDIETGDMVLLEKCLQENRAVALGEAGLDGMIKGVGMDKQLEILMAQMELARDLELPLVLHVRKAHDTLLKAMAKIHLPAGGVVHAFNGSVEVARAYLKHGFRLGIGGILSYPNNRKLKQVLAELPIESFLLESDAPDMAPAWWRAKRNTPASVALTAAMIARLLDWPLAELARQMRRNTEALFPTLRSDT